MCPPSETWCVDCATGQPHLVKSEEGVWLVFGDSKYPHDPPRVASSLEAYLWEQLQARDESLEQRRFRAALERIRDAPNPEAGWRIAKEMVGPEPAPARASPMEPSP